MYKAIALTKGLTLKDYIMSFVKSDLASCTDNKEDSLLVSHISKLLADIDSGDEKTYGYDEFAKLKNANSHKTAKAKHTTWECITFAFSLDFQMENDTLTGIREE